MNITQRLLSFTDKIEQKEIVTQDTAIKIRGYIRKTEDSTPIELFMIVTGIMGALFCAAGIFALISHNWDDYPKWIRGVFSVVPALVALYFYYRAVFHHPKSKTWIEASALFLMLMIGASIALVSQTYQMDGDFNSFIKVWALLTLPLFYFTRASGITLLYLGLITVLVLNVSIGLFYIPRFGESINSTWYWYLLLGFLPHYVLSLKKESRTQSIRIVYMSYVLYLSLMVAILVTVKGNYLLWILGANAVFYLIGKRLMGENSNIVARPFQWLSQAWIVLIFLGISNKFTLRMTFEQDSLLNLFRLPEGNMLSYMEDSGIDPNEGKMVYFVLLLGVLTLLYSFFFFFRKQFKDVSYLVLFAPVILIALMLFHEYVFPEWFVVLLINAYILLLGLSMLITGSENQNIAQMVVGILLISVLLWIRYFDTDWNFILKGLMFLGIGGVCFLINVVSKGKLERIERNKTRRDVG